MSISGLTPLKPLKRRFQSSNRPSKWVISGALKWTILGGVLETPNPMAPGSLLMLLHTPAIAPWGIRMCYGPLRVPQDPPKGVQNGSPEGVQSGVPMGPRVSGRGHPGDQDIPFRANNTLISHTHHPNGLGQFQHLSQTIWEGPEQGPEMDHSGVAMGLRVSRMDHSEGPS